ncbi:unnamed protein product [Rotaria sordida]|uniref:Uncharacterized protein n=1 Tax=Rotaria sordida TaxID=392033 RepID=A0A814CP10_9BILA|nr:unnamed protein product [Rotaria sordida]CAF0998432.1 unnamed protein product [Rotaria sordida]CAF3612927.1 unnamed protein product [Rotaria sordida]
MEFYTPMASSQLQLQYTTTSMQRRSILPTFPTLIYNHDPDLLLANVPLSLLSTEELARRQPGLYPNPFKIINPNPTTASLMVKYYNKHFLPILARFRIDLSILDHSYDHLYNFMKLFRASRRRILTANKCVEDLVDLSVEEVLQLFEFYLQMDVDGRGDHLEKFQDVEQCWKYIEKQSPKNQLTMIVSGQLGKEIVPSIHAFQQIISIYVYCLDIEGHKPWANKFSKIKAVEDDVDKLITQIEHDHKTRKILEESVSHEFFTVADKSTIGLNGKFVFLQVLIDCLLQLKATQKDKVELINRCKQQYEVNSFFSTTLDKQRALSFLIAPNLPRNLEGVLFEIDADPAVITTKPFANISEHGDFPEELEVLFMLGSIFRLNSVNYCSTDRVWIIKMALCSDDEHDSKDVLIYMKQQLNNGEINLRTLGKVLWAMGKFDLAEQYFNRLLEELSPTDPLIISLYDDLALMASHTHDYMKSVQWYQKLLKRKNSSRSDDVMGIKKPSDSVGTFI